MICDRLSKNGRVPVAAGLCLALLASRLLAGEEAPPDDVKRKAAELKAKSPAALGIEDRKAFVRDCLSCLERGFLVLGPGADDELTSAAEAAAKDMKCTWTASRIESFRLLLKKQKAAVDEAVQAMDRIAGGAGDPSLFRTVGRFECSFLSRWEEGLAHLAQASPTKLAETARRDLKNPEDPREQFKVGSAWLELAKGERGPVREAMWLRACRWFLKARPSVADKDRAKIEAAIAQAPWRYLADMEETEAKVGYGKFQNDGTVDKGTAIAVNGIKSPKGLFLHAAVNGTSRVVYKLGKGFRTLETHVAVADTGSGFADNAVFLVLADGKVVWKSQPITRPETSQACKVSLAGVDVLELQVRNSGGNRYGHTVWLDPMAIR